jgi:hypothetical protein
MLKAQQRLRLLETVTVRLSVAWFVLRPMFCAFSALWHMRAVTVLARAYNRLAPVFQSGFWAPATACDGSEGAARPAPYPQRSFARQQRQ